MVRSWATVGDGVAIRPSTIHGLGLFATRSFRPEEIVTAFEGTVCSYADVRGWDASRTTHCRSLFPLRMVLDGRCSRLNQLELAGPEEEEDGEEPDPAIVLHGRGGASYANDGRGVHPNNSEFTYVDSSQRKGPFDFSSPDLRIIVLQATQPIAAGEEILVSYGRDYWTRQEPTGGEPTAAADATPARASEEGELELRERGERRERKLELQKRVN